MMKGLSIKKTVLCDGSSPWSVLLGSGISMVCFTGFRITGETAKAHPLSAPMKTRPGKHNWREEAYPECVWYHPMGWEPWEYQWYKRKKSATSRRPLLSASSLLLDHSTLLHHTAPSVMCWSLWNCWGKCNILPLSCHCPLSHFVIVLLNSN